MRIQIALLGLVLAAATCALADDATTVRTAAAPPADRSNSNYVSNRDPLVKSPFAKLPIGAIEPRGWLRHQLELESDGLTGRLAEISPWLRFETSAWASKDGLGKSGWEEMPYWLKGYGDLGYVLRDEKIIAAAKKWIEAAMASQREDGYFGPRDLLKNINGRADLWPHMVMLNVFQSYYEYSGDERVLPFLEKYFRWQNRLSPDSFAVGHWPTIRRGDNLESVYWLYNRTGDDWLLELAEKIHANGANWTSGVIDWHGVNVTQGFREPGVYYQQARDPKFLLAAENNYDTVMRRYGQMPGGGFASDENCRPGYTDPRQGFETCSMVEFMHSFELLTRISGNPVWAERNEEIAFNSLPAAFTPDGRALHYLTGANMVQLDKNNKSPGIQNGGTMLSYSPFQVYRCCQHNVSHGWPYYAEELWLATSDDGLAISLYADSLVTAKVAGGAEVKIDEKTDYPFSDTVTLKFTCDRPAKFPLYLRVPRWCKAALITVNGKAIEDNTKPLSYVVLDREWKSGDEVKLKLPMSVSVRTWKENHDAVSVDYGPLTFSLAIGEKWVRYGGREGWPEQEVYPTTAWNYGLELDPKNPAASLEVTHREGSLADQPFTPETAPITIKAKGRKVPAWKLDQRGLLEPLQASPVYSAEPIESLTLIPMGAARLRITAFPVVSDDPSANGWGALRASHCNVSDTVAALADGAEPKGSNDLSIPRFTWWDHRGTAVWVERDYGAPRKMSAVEVYWFDDTGKGACRVPKSWRVTYRDGDAWKPVAAKGEYDVAKDKFNTVEFTPVETAALRIEVELQPEMSGGILEWKVRP